MARNSHRTARAALVALAVVGLASAASLRAEEATPARQSDDVVPPSPAETLRQALDNRYEIDARAVVSIKVTSRSGETLSQRAEVASKRIDGQLHSLGRFVYPQDIRGTALLAIENAGRDDDHFLYLPSMRRVRRVSSAQRWDLFLGTDATFEDLERRKVDDYRTEFLASTEIDGEPVRVVVATPTYASGYERIEYFIARDNAILESRHYRKGGEQPYKVIQTPRSHTREIAGHVLPTWILVKDVERGTQTEVAIDQLDVNPELPDNFFNMRSLSNEREIPGIKR